MERFADHAQSLHAFFSIDGIGIRFVIDRTDPFSFVSLDFGANSPWVINPYFYSARLDNSGFTASGETPLAGWLLTTTADTIEAFFAFGPNGQPFDAVTVRPPDFLFTVGHEYRYDATVANLALEILQAPEPPAWLILGTGVGLLLVYARRREQHPARTRET